MIHFFVESDCPCGKKSIPFVETHDYFRILRTKGNLIKKVDINSLIQIHCELPSDTLQKIAISPIYLV